MSKNTVVVYTKGAQVGKVDKKKSAFNTTDIDRAIVMTQYDLRGFAHPLGFRMSSKSPKMLDTTMSNMLAFATGHGSSFLGDKTFEECVDLCKHLVLSCDLSQKEAIQLIVIEIAKRSRKSNKPAWYSLSRKTDNPWWKGMRALAQAFEIDLRKPQIRQNKSTTFLV